MGNLWAYGTLGNQRKSWTDSLDSLKIGDPTPHRWGDREDLVFRFEVAAMNVLQTYQAQYWGENWAFSYEFQFWKSGSQIHEFRSKFVTPFCLGGVVFGLAFAHGMVASFLSSTPSCISQLSPDPFRGFNKNIECERHLWNWKDA